MSDSVRPHRRQPTTLLCPWDSPGKNTGVGGHFLLQCMKGVRECLISWLQSPSVVILEPPKIKSDTVSTLSLHDALPIS